MPISATAIYAVDMKFHDDFLWLAYPDPGAQVAGNTVIYVYNTRSGGWTVWRDMPVGCLIPVPPDPVSGTYYSMYFGGTDGQIWQLDPAATYDTVVEDGPPVAIPIAVTSRGIGREGDQIRQVKAVHGHADIDSSELLTIRIANDKNDRYYDYPVNFPGRRYSPVKQCGNGVVGNYCTIGVSGSVTTPTRIYTLDLTTVETNQQR
jgi:hypothetical protein